MSLIASTVPKLHVIEIKVLLGEEGQKQKGSTNSYKEGNTTE